MDEKKNKLPVIAQLAVKNHLVTKDEAAQALASCAGADNLEEAVGNYFLSQELVSAENMKRLTTAAKAFDFRQKEFRFGTIAIKMGFINKSIMDLALEEQQSEIKHRGSVKPIGEMLVEAGMMTEKQKDHILKIQKRDLKTAVKQADETSQKQAETPEKAPEDENPMLDPLIIEGGIRLEIRKDGMAAFFTKTPQFDSSITVDEIKEALFDRGIVAGLAVDEMLQGFINSGGFKEKSFRAASGTPAVEGRDSRVEYFFNTDYLKAGGMTEDGTIDFKDRGEIPVVEKGTVLAEKIPMQEAREGKNIYGEEIPVEIAQDIPLQYGDGVRESEDRFKLLADVTGVPKYSLSGRVFVHEEYIARGDIDFETGHVQYKGNVRVMGRIKSGFKVTANDIQAMELDGGQIEAEGNVRIAGGINEGDIYARGNVFAKFIHSSTIRCLGNVVVEKEIVDSEVENSGKCYLGRGKIIASRVSSKMGVKVGSIGTEKSGPSMIEVGRDVFLEKELRVNQKKIDDLKDRLEKHKERTRQFNKDSKSVQEKINELAHVQDRSQLEIRDIQSKIDAGMSRDQLHEAEAGIADLQEKIKHAEENLDHLFNEEDDLGNMITAENNKIGELEVALKEFVVERQNLLKISRENPGNPVVAAQGAVMNGTIIRGLHSKKIINEEIRHARIVEKPVDTGGEGDSEIYDIKVENL